ncbi:hypothetical protein [Pseudomonas sp. S3E17]|jgi:hypothetical protein|uniref:hypothetical protein n=1 Tax=Pseudomonas sp. S3E17 TaxID=2817893 RepID=UPI00209FE588|nr:hypothetical protein [Pseudomonas sp. S3E17]MCP1467167.1 hypothetical protein [Pseudomonas sp. S3E17]
MSIFNSLPEELSKNAKNAHRLYKQRWALTSQEQADAKLFYELAVKSTLSQMAYLEHTRVSHMLLKSTFESFQ